MLSGQLAAHGMDIVPWGEKADAIVIHTCAVTTNAERNCLRLARSAKRDFPDAKIVLAGCAVQVDRERVRKESGADILLDQTQKFELPNALAKAGLTGRSTSLPSETHQYSTKTRASIKVQDGCEFGCSYCIVPRARGKSVSRDHKEIINEISHQALSGIKEVVLTGANIGTYNDDGINLPSLVKMIENIDGIYRIRISSIEPTTAEEDIVRLMAGSTKLCRYLHLPIQSGDDSILKLMRRRHSISGIAAFIKKAKDAIPTLGIGTDIIVGFPGETDAMFANTMAFLESLPFSNIHAFSYSKRPETDAARMPDQIHPDITRQRVNAINRLKDLKKNDFALSFFGKTVEVLVERVNKKGIGTGWTSEYIEASVKSAERKSIISFVPSSIADGCISMP